MPVICKSRRFTTPGNDYRHCHLHISFLTDDTIQLRYVEIDGQLRKILVVMKMRGGNHSKDIREYVITERAGVIIHPRRTGYHGVIAGIPQRTGPRKAQENEAPARTEGDEVEEGYGRQITITL